VQLAAQRGLQRVLELEKLSAMELEKVVRMRI
jgi:hypothetical protein